MREQSYLKSELGLGLGEMGFEIPAGESSESVFSQATSESSSVCSSPSHHASRRAAVPGQTGGKRTAQSVARKKVFRASVALTPTAPSRTGSVQTPPELESSEEAGVAEEGVRVVGPNSDMEEECAKLSVMPAAEEMQRSVEQNELQQVIREVSPAVPTSLTDVGFTMNVGHMRCSQSPCSHSQGVFTFTFPLTLFISAALCWNGILQV